MIKIINVDDHLLFRMGTRLALIANPEIEIIGEAASGKELFEMLTNNTPDVVVLDLILPDMHGFDAAKRMKQEYPDIKILILSGEMPENVVDKLLEIGVEGYLTKSTSLSELEEAIISVANGIEYLGKDVARVLCQIVKAKSKEIEKAPELTKRELEIVELCSEGLLSKEIADKLHISYHTVNFHKNNIFKKLGINNTVEMAKYAIKNGIISILLFLFFSFQFVNADSVEVLYQQGQHFFLEARNDSALIVLDNAVEMSPIDDPNLQLEIYLLRSRVLGNLAFFERAMTDAVRALEISDNLSSDAAKAASLMTVGKVYYMMYNDTLADRYLKQAENLAQKSNSQKELMLAKSALAQLYSAMGRNDECLVYAKTSLEMAEEQSDTINIIQNLLVLASYYINLNSLNDTINELDRIEILRHLDKANMLAAQFKIPMLMINTNLHLIRYYRMEKDFNKALGAAQKVISLSHPSHYSVLIQVYDHLVGIYANIGNMQQVIDNHQKFYELMRRQSDYNLHNAVQEMKVKYETAEKELEIEKQKSRNTLLVFLMLLMFAVIALALYFLRIQKKLSQHLSKLNVTKDKFFSVISHDLKNPAIAQRNALQGLIEHSGELDVESLKIYYTELLNSADKQIELLFNLLNWAQLQLGKYSFQPQLIDFSELLKNELELLESLREPKNINIIQELPNTAEIIADKIMLASVIRNLLSNAVKFTPVGGEIIIKMENMGRKNKISVEDTGIGMSREQIDTIFDIERKTFRQGSRGEESTGLGLIICKEIVEKHNSHLFVESEEGKGSRFWFEI